MKTLTMKSKIKNMGYLILPAIAGLAIILQTAFSGKLTKDIGAIETVLLIHLFGLIVAIIVYLIIGNISINLITNFNALTVISGCLGVIIVFSISKSFLVNGAFVTIMISVLVQLVGSKIIDHFGLFGAEQVPINMMQVLSLLLIVSGVVLYQYKQ